MSVVLEREVVEVAPRKVPERRKELVLLKKARALLSHPDSWCKGAFAKNVHGSPVDEKGPEAVRWCAAGALLRYSVVESDQYARALCRLRGAFGYRDVVLVNDTEGYAAVIAGFDRAIYKLERGNA